MPTFTARPRHATDQSRRSWSILVASFLVSGCAAPARTSGAGTASPATAIPPASATSTATTVTVLEVRMRRSAELIDNRGALRLFDQDLRLQYRAGPGGPGLDAGEVTLDGQALHRVVGRKGSVEYRLGREEPEGGMRAGGSPWLTLVDAGGPGLSADTVRVKLAPFPLVTQPAPDQGVPRDDELAIVMLPPVAEVWVRVTLTGAGDPVSAIDLGQGRWLFPRGSLEKCNTGRARVLIEVEASCGDCPSDATMRADWSSRSELELPVTLQ